VTEPAAVNTSPLVFFSKGDCFDLLQMAGPRLVVPQTVVTETYRRGPNDVTSRAVRRAPWLTVVPDPEIPPLIQAWDLGPGESAVLAWAYSHPGTEVVMDDLAARRCAATIHVPVRGTLGLVLKGKQRGVIGKARPVLQRMVQAGMYLSEHVLNDALTLVGE